ncbi:hypothetical protein ACJJTC_001123 [Scirpophaga incertulas]
MVPQTKVFVGSLPQGSKPEDLRKLFERFGVVTECDIMNRCGFVHMQTEDQASAAIRGLNNTQFNGGVITVERGRIKERGARGGRGGMRGGMRGGGGDRRGGGRGRDAPYARPPMRGGGGGAPYGAVRNGMGGYDRGAERAPYDDRYNGYGGEDRRGFALARDPYAAPAPMYGDDRRGYGAPAEDMAMYDDRRAAMYGPGPDERDMLDRRALRHPHAHPHAHPPPHHMPAPQPYDRPAPRPAPIPSTDMFSRRSPMRGGPAGPTGYERDPYAQQYAPMGRYA